MLTIFSEILIVNFPLPMPLLLELLLSPQTTLSQYREPEFSVVRQHEEFIWLHDRYLENEEYAGMIVSCTSDVNSLVLIINFEYMDRALI